MTILCIDNNLCQSLGLGAQNIFYHKKYLSLYFNKLFILTPKLLRLAKKLLLFILIQDEWYMNPIRLFLRSGFMRWINNMMQWKKEGVLANLYLMKIHFLIIRLFIAKGISSWIMKIFR